MTVGLVVDGWPDDLRECVRALVARTEAKILALDLGDVDGAGTVLNELVKEFPRRVEAWHVAETPHWRGGTAGWGESRTKLLKLDTADVHVVMETSTILDGDAITPLVEELKDDVTGAGWRGVNPREDGHEWVDAEPGEVRGLLGTLFAVKRDAALAAGASRPTPATTATPTWSSPSRSPAPSSPSARISRSTRNGTAAITTSIPPTGTGSPAGPTTACWGCSAANKLVAGSGRMWGSA